MTETIQQLKEDIAILQMKLQKLEEMENHKTPCEIAFKRVYYRYPPTSPSVSNFEDIRWSAFQDGFFEGCKVEEPDESVEEYLKPHTPEKTEQLLREAFQKVQQTEEWKETQRKIDGKNPLEFLKFELGQSLTDLIYDWWEDVFTKNSNDDIENCIGRLVYWIEEWLPKEQNASGAQNAYVECSVEGFNDAIKKIKSKIHNKKDT